MGGWAGGAGGVGGVGGGGWVGGWVDGWMGLCESRQKPTDMYDRGCNAEETEGTLFLSPTLHRPDDPYDNASQGVDYRVVLGVEPPLIYILASGVYASGWKLLDCLSLVQGGKTASKRDTTTR